ncbi:MAG: methyltransferase [Acidobacteria bacterium]|nr:methyltransferase [Acidobacteriota bacterium]
MVSAERILQTAAGFQAARHLMAASAIGLFEALAGGPQPLDTIAARCGIPARTMRISADAMVALGLLSRQGDCYANSPEADAFLAGKSPSDLRPFLRFWSQLSYPRWMMLEECLRAGAGSASFLTGLTEDEQKIFSEGVEAITTGSAMALADCYDFSGHRRLLDLGGGTGSFLLPILEKHPALECALFELPSVIDLVRRRGNPARLHLIAADMMRDPIPNGYDAVLMANVLHCFSANENQDLLERIRAGVEPGARLLLVDFWLDATRTQPVFAALMSGEFLLDTAGGQSYSEDEGRSWLEATGWTFVGMQPLGGPSAVLIGEAAA